VNRTSGWDPDHGRRSAGLVGEVSSCRDRAVRPRRHGVGADAVARAAADGVGGAKQGGAMSDSPRKRPLCKRAEVIYLHVPQQRQDEEIGRAFA
jgi:hypothetical protein